MKASLCHFGMRGSISFAAVWGTREDYLNACDLQFITFLVCQVFRNAGPLTNWTPCLRKGGKQQTQAEGLGEGGVTAVYLLPTFTTCSGML